MAEPLTTSEPNAVIIDQGMVYCRFPSGEVHAVDASPMELMKKINRGIVPLGDYGQFGSSAYYMDHPYEPLFQAGGAREMSVEQVIELGYHLRPPIVPTCEQHVGQSKEHLMHSGRPGASSAKAQGCWRGARPVRFPQLQGIELPPPPDACEFCDRDDFATERALKQHQEVMHRDRRQQQELGEAIVSGLQRTGMIASGNGASPQAVAAAVAATLQALGYGTPIARPEPEPEEDEEEEEGPDEPRPTPAPAPPQVTDLKRERANELRRQRRAAARRVPIEATAS
jgi:hypothetical protein